MVSIHKTRHRLRNKRTSARPHSTYRTFTNYLHGTKHYKFTIELTTTLRANTNSILDPDVHVDVDWAGCPTTRKPTSGFNLIFLGTTVAFGSRTQATTALSSAESEPYAICAGVNEGLPTRNQHLQQAKPTHSHRPHSRQAHCYTTRYKQTSKTYRPQIPLHTRPIKHDIIRILKINTVHNSADSLTTH